MIWQKATIVSGAPGGRVSVDAAGIDSVSFLAPKFVQNDGSDYGTIGFGINVFDGAGLATAPAWKANGAVGAATTGTTVAGPLPTYAADDILLAMLFCRGSVTAFTMPAGWDEITQITLGADQYAWFVRRATASESSPTVTNLGRTSTNLLSAQLTSFSGCRATGTVYEALANASSASGVLAGANVVATRANRLAVQSWIKAANTATAPDGTWTERLDQGTGGGGACRFMLDTAPVASPGTIAAASRASSAETYVMIGIALIP